MKAKEFIIEYKKDSKPRNFVAKNASLAGKAGQHKDKKKAEKQGDVKHKKELATMESALSELSTGKLAQYKKAAGADASAADKVGDTKKADKRFSGIVRATKKQFANDDKGVAEVTGDKPFDSMMRTIKKGTEKQKTADRRAEKAHSQQRARDAFGPNPAASLGIRKPSVAEVSLGDYREKALKQKAQSQMGAMFNKDPEKQKQDLATFNKRERGLNRLKARDEVARKSTADKQMADNIAKLPELKAEYERMKAKYKTLGGSNWQYADREQNLTDRERQARSMEGPMNNLWRTISAAEKAQKSQGAAEGFGSKLAGLGLAGAMAFGAGGANARVTPDGQGGFTGGFKPTATMTAPSDNKPAAAAPTGYNKEYLQKAANPDRTGRYMISVEKAQQLLKQMDSKVGEAATFAGTKVGHKQGPAGQWRNDGAKKNTPAKPGDLVGGGM